MMIAEYEFEPETVDDDGLPLKKPTLGEAFASLQADTDRAITAAGGWSAPLETTYDLLPNIRAERGGIQYGAIDLAEAHLVREVDNVEAEPEDQAGVNMPEIRALINDFQRERYEPVYIFLGDSNVREVGKINTAHGPQGVARLLRQVADRLDS